MQYSSCATLRVMQKERRRQDVQRLKGNKTPNSASKKKKNPKTVTQDIKAQANRLFLEFIQQIDSNYESSGRTGKQLPYYHKDTPSDVLDEVMRMFEAQNISAKILKGNRDETDYDYLELRMYNWEDQLIKTGLNQLRKLAK